MAHILVKDTDRGLNGIIKCNLTSPADFKIQGYDVKEYKVIVARQLDRERTPVHNVTVQCADAGQPPLTASQTFQVKVTDENDNAPVFDESEVKASLEENNKVRQLGVKRGRGWP